MYIMYAKLYQQIFKLFVINLMKVYIYICMCMSCYIVLKICLIDTF